MVESGVSTRRGGGRALELTRLAGINQTTPGPSSSANRPAAELVDQCDLTNNPLDPQQQRTTPLSMAQHGTDT